METTFLIINIIILGYILPILSVGAITYLQTGCFFDDDPFWRFVAVFPAVNIIAIILLLFDPI